MTTDLFRPVLTLLSAIALLLASLGMLGCSTAQTSQADEQYLEACDDCETEDALAKFEKDRKAILGMAGEYDVTFNFEETLALRQGYELKDPYRSEASELVMVIKDMGERISLQHILVVEHDGEQHVIKHWRQDWQYQGDKGFDYKGDNVWEQVTYNDQQVRGAWVQSVYQVDDSPRYWGIGKWEHRDSVSTWSGATNRPLPRREHTKRDDYQVLGAVNTHVVTDSGWVHYQSNHKIDTQAEEDKVIALESGVNTYVKTDKVDFTKAREHWAKSSAYWAQVREAWAEVYADNDRIELLSRWKGDKMFTHMFDLADLYWGEEDVSAARPKIDEIIEAFMDVGLFAKP